MTETSTIAAPDSGAGIRVSRVEVRGFRCVREARLDLSPGTTYLVGENNSGKTSILLALWSALGSRRPLDDDLRREGDGTLADEAAVDLLPVPAKGQRFAPRTAQDLVLVQRDPATGSETVGIRTTFLPSREDRVLATRRSLLSCCATAHLSGARSRFCYPPTSAATQPAWASPSSTVNR